MSEELLKSIDKHLFSLVKLVTEAVHAMREAEKEVPESMRRFIMYMHDMHDVKNLYTEHGLEVPAYVLREVERCDDRLRQLLTRHHEDGGVFEKVRREMAQDAENRWDHTRALAPPKGAANETGNSTPVNGRNEDSAGQPRSEPGVSGGDGDSSGANERPSAGLRRPRALGPDGFHERASEGIAG